MFPFTSATTPSLPSSNDTHVTYTYPHIGNSTHSTAHHAHATHLLRQACRLHHRIDGHLKIQHLTPRIDIDLLGEVTLYHRLGHLRDGAYLVRQIRCHVLTHARASARQQ